MATAFGREPLSPGRRWAVVAAATGLMQLSYWPTVAAIMLDDQAGAGLDAALGVGLSLVPLVFMLLAFASRHPRAPRAVLRAMGLFLVVALPLGLLHVALGMAAGFSAGGISALRAEPGVHSTRARLGAAVAVTLGVAMVMPVALEIGLILGALLPFPALATIDAVVERQGRGRA